MCPGHLRDGSQQQPDTYHPFSQRYQQENYLRRSNQKYDADEDQEVSKYDRKFHGE
jgi:hypothetical protein